MDPGEILKILPDTVPYDPKRQYLIDHVGKVDKLTFQILVGTFTAIGIVAVIIRIVLNLKHRGKLFLDDYLVLFASVCLVFETGILYYWCNTIYIILLLMIDPSNITLFSRLELLALMRYLTWNNVFLVLSWTTNYAVKMSFLAFFRMLVRGVSKRLNWWWWFVFCFTLVSWLWNVTENWIICGAGGSFKCFPYPDHNVAVATASTGADIVTDLMIVSVPIILLQKSQLRPGQKLRILMFLCLNILFCAFALGRHIGGMFKDEFGVTLFQITWTSLWLHLEACVAVLMGGVTAFRTVFASHARERHHRNSDSLSSTLYYRFRKFIKRSTSRYDSAHPPDNDNRNFLPGPQTGGTLSGVKTFIRRFNRDPGQTTAVPWDNSSYDPLESYHAIRRMEPREHADASTLAPSHRSGSGEGIQLEPLPERPLPTLQTHNLV